MPRSKKTLYNRVHVLGYALGIRALLVMWTWIHHSQGGSANGTLWHGVEWMTGGITSKKLLERIWRWTHNRGDKDAISVFMYRKNPFLYKRFVVHIAWTLADLLTAECVRRATVLGSERERNMKESDHEKEATCQTCSSSLFMPMPLFSAIHTVVLYLETWMPSELAYALYLLHPYTLVAYVTCSPQSWLNVFISGVLLCSLQGSSVLSGAFFGILVCLDPQTKLLSWTMMVLICSWPRSLVKPSLHGVKFLLTFVLVGWTTAVVLYSVDPNAFSHHFQRAFYFQDFTPHIGMLWCFLTHMFLHALPTYVLIVRLCPIVLTIACITMFTYRPFIGVRGRHSIIYLVLSTLGVHCGFSPFPSLSRNALWFTLVCSWLPTSAFHQLRWFFIFSLTAAMMTALWPIAWYMWLVVDSFNPHILFDIGVVYTICTIVMVLEVVHVARKATILYDCREQGIDVNVDKDVLKLL